MCPLVVRFRFLDFELMFVHGWLVGWGLDLPLQIVSLEVINAMLHFVTWFWCQIEDNALVYVSGCLTVS